jgi:polyisoprenyl-teichoic acid--peptidoglycan teichoic acid transferase
MPPTYTVAVTDLDDFRRLSDSSEDDGSAAGDEGRDGSDAAAARPRRRRRFWVLLAAVLLLVVPIAAIGGYAAYLGHMVTSNVQHDDLLPALTPDQLKGNPGAAPAPGATAVTGKGMNFLLIGSDAGPDRSGARSDVIMLVHVPEDRHNITFVHFPRDLYVDIPGYNKNKINAAFAYGGAPLLVTTLQNLTGAHIDHVAKIGFEGFKAMTDAVGGVDVYVAESSSQDTVKFVGGTTMHMDGATALQFVRARYQLSQGDISRGQRQQEFLKSLMLKMLSSDTLTNPAKLSNLVYATTTNLTVDQDLDLGAMQQLGLSMRNIRGSDVRFITAPFSGFATNAAGDVDVVDVAKMTALGQAVAQDQLDAYTG